MNIHDAAVQYLVYLKAVRLPADELSMYRSAISNIVWFYGKNKPLETFDEATTLQYVKINDPFDCDKLHEERGEVYCNFTQWLMANRLIPAWAGASMRGSRWLDCDGSETLDNFAAM